MNAVRKVISGDTKKGYLPISAHKPANAAAFPRFDKKTPNYRLPMNATHHNLPPITPEPGRSFWPRCAGSTTEKITDQELTPGHAAHPPTVACLNLLDSF